MSDTQAIDDVQLCTPDEVAEQAKISVRSLRRMVREGRAPAPVRVGLQSVRFYEHEVRAWLACLPRTREAA